MKRYFSIPLRLYIFLMMMLISDKRLRLFLRRYSQTEKVYQGATLNNVITGKVDFNADIIWHDGANEASRKNNTNPGGIVLWRYTNESGNDTPADRERSAQAETGSLVKTDENGQVVLGTDGKPVYLDKIEFKNLEKYDRFGNPYVYYAKETLDSNLGNYQAVYSDTDCAKNNGSITNNLAGTRNFVVEAEWKAAARQGGDASVTYEYVTYPTDLTDPSFVANNSQYYNSSKKRFEIDKDDNESYNEPIRTWYIELQVPMYDDEGHEYQYDVTESNPGFGVTGTDSSTHEQYSGSYIMRVGYTPKNPSDQNSADTYTLTNTYTEGPGYTMIFKKVWKDDGDLLHREDTKINYNMGDGVSGAAVLKESNVWEEHVGRNENYVYNSGDFSESRNEGSGTSYTPIAIIKNEYPLTVSFNNLAAGTYRVSQKNGNNCNIVRAETELTQTGSVSANLSKKTNLKLEKKIPGTGPGDPDTWQVVTGLTTSNISLSGYVGSSIPAVSVNADGTVAINYAGQELYTRTDGTSAVTGFEWINSVISPTYNGNANSIDLKDLRIIKFDKLVAVYKDNNHYYAVEQLHNGDGTVTFVNTRIGVVSYEIDLDLCMGGWENTASAEEMNFKIRIKGKVNGSPLKYSGTNTEVSIERKINIQDGQHKYYLTDLPKYDGEGKIIDWEIEEIKFAGKTIGLNSVGEKSFTIDGKNCVVTITAPSYTYGTDSHSDDLIKIKLTNRFKGSTSATVNKMWNDDNNALGLRGDTYIQLWYRSKNPNSSTWKQLGGDYVWKATQETEWHYEFSDLDEFDENGYQYEYAIKELPIQDYSSSSYSVFSPSTGIGTLATGLDPNMVPSGGWFVDRLSGEVVIDGKKLWNKISTVLDKKHYPIANIEINRQNKYKTINGTFTVDKNEFTEDANNPGTYVATRKITSLVAGTYRVEAVDNDLTIVSPSGEQTVGNNGGITVNLAVTGQPDADKSYMLQYKENNIWKNYFRVLTSADDFTKIGQTSIYSGDNRFVFKKDSSWYDDPDTLAGLNQNEIKEGFYVKDGNEPKTENVGSQTSQPVYSMVLPKFDNNGALITYHLKEIPIQGYVFEISNDKIVNEYNGGRPLEITVTKNWENMDNIEYPSVKLILHQIMFAKTSTETGYLLDANNQPVITPVEYATFEKILKKGEDGCTGFTGCTYTFGELNNDGTRKKREGKHQTVCTGRHMLPVLYYRRNHQ